ncbi:zinc finger, c3HC4 type (RING finger) domain-containing protein [Phthorimaea operculella]|nr:zinc finger, c3HC4 type (RING finger) domain-containing protein [Phthorimaea operculella]
MSGSAASGSGVGSSSAAASTSAVALGGLGGSLEDKDCDLLCPVCFELIEEAYVTRCGHSFCYSCIAKSVELHRRCPKCGAALASRDHIFPNFLLNELVAKRRLRQARPGSAGAVGPAADAERLRAMLNAESGHLAIADVDSMLDVLTRRKRLLEAESSAAHHRLLYEFLTQLHRHRQQQLEQLNREAALVRSDMAHVAQKLQQLGSSGLACVPESSGPESDAARTLRRELTLSQMDKQSDKAGLACVPESSGAESDAARTLRRELTLSQIDKQSDKAGLACVPESSGAESDAARTLRRELTLSQIDKQSDKAGLACVPESSGPGSDAARTLRRELTLSQINKQSDKAGLACVPESSGAESDAARTLRRELIDKQNDKAGLACVPESSGAESDAARTLRRELIDKQNDKAGILLHDRFISYLPSSSVTFQVHQLPSKFISYLPSSSVTFQVHQLPSKFISYLPSSSGLACVPESSGPESDAARTLRRELTLSQIDKQSDKGEPMFVTGSTTGEEEESFAGGGGGSGGGDALQARWRRLTAHFDDFVQCYFAHRADELYFPGCSTSPPPSPPVAQTSPPPPVPPASSTEDHVPQAHTTSPANNEQGGDQRLPEGVLSETPTPGTTSNHSRPAVTLGGSRGLDAFREDLVAFTRYSFPRPSLSSLTSSSKCSAWTTLTNEHRAAFRSAGERTGVKFRSA